MKTIIGFLALLLSLNMAIAQEPASYRVIDNSYTACQTEAQYRQLLKWSLYGVGQPPQTGCMPAPANAKAVILQCPESDIIVCQIRLTPEDGSPAREVWASKVMLRPAD